MNGKQLTIDVMVSAPLAVEGAREWLDNAERYSQDITSAVGHASTARLFSTLLDRDVDANRVSVTIDPRDNDMAIVGQYVGPRLDEGATTLPEGAMVTWRTVGIRISNPSDHYAHDQ